MVVKCCKLRKILISLGFKFKNGVGNVEKDIEEFDSLR